MKHDYDWIVAFDGMCQPIDQVNIMFFFLVGAKESIKHHNHSTVISV